MGFELDKLRKLVAGKIFQVEFIKKDGTIRSMNCRLGVTRHLKGGELSYNPYDFNYLPVYDMQSQGYRTVNINTIIRLKVDGIEYDVMKH